MYAKQPYEQIYGSWEPASPVAARTAAVCKQALRQAVAENGQAVIAIPGGRSITRVLEALRDDPEVPWEHIHIFWVDERWVPLEHPDSNFGAAWQPVLQPLVAAGRMHQDQVHPFRYRSDLPDGGVGLYQSEFRQYAADSAERFDLVLLGVGEDGHCASLFPRHPALAETGYGFIAVDNSPKPPPQRMSASRTMIAAARCAVLLFFGEGKRTALERFGDDEVPIEACPCKIALQAVHTVVVTDLG
ncbi:6-phosphogluconolactonase [Spirochaeta africana]|uniref:6-phosphogluconolactonase n=1 Tax=Spirochaeta africana (strain ATCC 700263 / DSM 8902 / Z-7692) TaxID=889378 RepID=H9UFW0_SPIAZ|nr:6-phosphogluconolactonase [Spirochaeta africana]AFG36403.1 6-phosphogluconolactonase [Spirochaeta africana DSM 8902]